MNLQQKQKIQLTSTGNISFLMENTDTNVCLKFQSVYILLILKVRVFCNVCLRWKNREMHIYFCVGIQDKGHKVDLRMQRVRSDFSA